ncbi:putative Cell division control protein 2 [Fusarium oxysporum f. sp. albedinis]|nr:putative Cell division control protein 2 [Fusarium oxysporum f. sp. albedinis]
MATLHPTKSTTPVPERTEEDNQRRLQHEKAGTLTKRNKQTKSNATKAPQNTEPHLYTHHNGSNDPTSKRQKTTKETKKAQQAKDTIQQLNQKEQKEQEVNNTEIKRFDKTVFQQNLVNWIVNSNQSFSIVNDQGLRDIFNYLNPSVEITKANITDVTVRAIAEREFTNNMERVKDALRKSPGQIHIQYDGWKSGNRHALYGITCVFRDSNNRPQKCVLGLPELTERYTGENIAGQINEIIREYEISDKLGYFTLDNAGNNKTSMGELGLEFGFDWEKRWMLSREVFEGLHTAAKEHEVWRRRGSVGKWHNFAVEVSRSDMWTDMLKKVQAVESQLSDDAQLKKHRPVGVVVDNATRWLSQFSMIERALVLRPFYNSFVQRASNEWEKVNLTRAGHIKKGSKLPFFLKEENRMTADDWHVLGTLYDILLDFQLVVRGLEGDGQGKHRRKVEENEIDPPLSGTSWDLIHAYEFLLESLESAKRAVANFPDSHHLAVNINLGWLKLNEYYEHLNDSPLIYGAAVLHPAYRWALFDDLWGDDDERQLWITKAKEMVQDLWEREYRDLEVDDPEIELPANKRLKTSRNKFTAWRTKKRGLTARGISVTESPIQSPAQSPRSSVGGLDLDEYEQWQRDIEDSDASVTDPYEYWHKRRLKYPRLSRMALDLLTVPPMSAECERLFSTTGRMVTKSRNRLDASTIGLCQTLRSWLRAGLIGSLDRILMDE